jgi:hypothetical protein
MSPVHICLDGEGQLCSDKPFQAVDYFRTDVATARELCGNCMRAFRKRSNLEDASEEEILKAIRGDYDSTNPNKFWQSYGVTVWSKSE